LSKGLGPPRWFPGTKMAFPGITSKADVRKVWLPILTR